MAHVWCSSPKYFAEHLLMLSENLKKCLNLYLRKLYYANSFIKIWIFKLYFSELFFFIIRHFGYLYLTYCDTLHTIPLLRSLVICLCGFSYHALHDDVIKWKHLPRYWPFVRGIYRSPVNSPHKGQWRGALLFSLICAWINGWVNTRGAGDLRRHRAHYDVIVMENLNDKGVRLIVTEFHGDAVLSRLVFHIHTLYW